MLQQLSQGVGVVEGPEELVDVASTKAGYFTVENEASCVGG